jgi:hypothetical protein
MERKVEKYLKSSFELSVEQVKNHYLVAKVTNAQVYTAGPFLKAVDPAAYPDYATIITDPMDLAKITKNIKNNKYSIAETSSASTAILSILHDMELIRTNAHTYNASPESVEIRIMADCLRNYFRYLLRVCLKLFQQLSSDPSLVSYMIHLPEVEDFLTEYDTEDVFKFLSVSGIKIDDIIEKAGLFKQLGVKSSSPEVRNTINEVTAVNLPPKASSPTPPPVTPKSKAARGGSKASSNKGNMAAAAAATFVPPSLEDVKPVKNKRSISHMSVDEPLVGEISPSLLPPPLTATRSRSNTGPASKRRKGATAMEESHDVYDQESSSGHHLFIQPPLPSSSTMDDNDDMFMLQDTPLTRTSTKGSSMLSPGPSSSSKQQQQQAFASSLTASGKLVWEEAANDVLKTLSRHPYVDATKPTAAADFFHPVIEINPHIAEDYLKIIHKPMDLNTIRHRLEIGSILDSQEFYELILRVFQNALDYNAPHIESQYAMKLVDQCRHLVNYSKWLCLEYLPLQDDTSLLGSSENAEYLGDLRISCRDKARKAREEIVSSAYFHELSSFGGGNPYSECKKLLKDLERTNKKQELIQLSYFIQPVDVSLVTDYLVYVRQPADLSTIKYRLDGTEPSSQIINQAINRHASRYQKIHDFITDIRRVFSNAKLYNKNHLESDTTQISKAIYEAATIFEEKLENLLPRFTLGLTDRIECCRLQNKEFRQMEESKRLRKLKDEEETRQLEQAMIEDYKKSDKMFAADYDIDMKRKQTEKLLKAQVDAKKMSVIEGTSTIIKSTIQDELLADDLSSPNLSPEISPTSLHPHGDKGNENKAIPCLVYGYGIGGQIPKRFQENLETKALLRRRAWDFFPVEMTNNKPAVIS